MSKFKQLFHKTAFSYGLEPANAAISTYDENTTCAPMKWAIHKKAVPENNPRHPRLIQPASHSSQR
jgi:hypothetical protein